VFKSTVKSTMGIILLFADVLPQTFPGETALATKVCSTMGAGYHKDLYYNRGINVVTKPDNTAITAKNYTYAQKSDGSCQEFVRTVAGVDATASTGTWSVGTLTTINGTQTMHDALQANSEGTIVTAISSVDPTQSSTVTMNYNGISMSTDTSSMYFGANGTFRLRYGPGEDVNGKDVFVIESLQLDGSYKPKFQVSNA
jgi:hypothetical protein